MLLTMKQKHFVIIYQVLMINIYMIFPQKNSGIMLQEVVKKRDYILGGTRGIEIIVIIHLTNYIKHQK